MIAWLKGTVLHVEKDEVVLENRGVGYLVHAGRGRILQSGLKPDMETEFVIYTHVKEDEIKYFGFASFHERRVFLYLIGVNGVGPKMGMNIIDQLGANRIIQALEQGDHSPFQGVSGIGKKTAQRIVLDLKDKLKDEPLFSGINSQQGLPGEGQSGFENRGDLFEDLQSALKNLGFQPQQINRALQKHYSAEADFDTMFKKCLVDLSPNK